MSLDTGVRVGISVLVDIGIFGIPAKLIVKILCDVENNIMGVVPLRQDRILMAQKDQKDIIKVSF